MPNSFLAFAGKSMLSSFPPLSARCSDHSANEILKNRSALASPVTRESADCWLPFELDPPMQLTREAGNIPPVPASRERVPTFRINALRLLLDDMKAK